MNSNPSFTVVVASANPVKVAATRAAFGELFPHVEIDIVTASVRSGVSEQPVGDRETRDGARQRARNAREAAPGGEFWVGMEGGVEEIDEVLYAFAWMAILGRDGRIGESRSVLLPLPDPVRRRVKEGVELGKANDELFKTENSKQAGGAFGLLTGGRHTRESVYHQTLTMALLPFANAHYRGDDA